MEKISRNNITKEQFDTLNFHPESLRYDIFSRFDKIADEYKNQIKGRGKELKEIETVIRNNPFTTVDFFVDSIKDTKKIIEKLNEIDTSEKIKQPATTIFDKSLIQIQSLFDLYKISNFGSTELDYYEIMNQADEFISRFLEEHFQDMNLINYDILNSSLKTNFILQKILEKRTNNLTSVFNIIETEADKEKNFVFDEEEIFILKEFNHDSNKIMEGSLEHLTQKTFTNTPYSLLKEIYKEQNKIVVSEASTNTNNKIIKKSAIKVASKAVGYISLYNKELYKYSELDRINFKLFNSRFKDFAETEQILYNFN